MSTPPPGRAGITEARLARLLEDRALLSNHYPELRFELDDRRATARAVGAIMIGRPDGSTEAVDVRIEFAAGYPTTPPRSYDALRRWKPEEARHIEPDHHFCLFLAGVDNPDLTGDGSLLEYMAELEAFVRQQLILDSLRKRDPSARFPGPEWAHGAQAYAAFAALLLAAEPQGAREPLWQAAVSASVGRQEPCPCGSDRRYDSCHFGLTKRLRRARYEAWTRGAGFDHLTYDQLAQQAPHHA